MLAPIRPVLERADLAIVNLETPIGWFKKPQVGEMIFNAEPPLVGALKRAGVDVAAFANNHCLDQSAKVSSPRATSSPMRGCSRWAATSIRKKRGDR